jgi:predicted phage terminase large subunit-like protein
MSDNTIRDALIEAMRIDFRTFIERSFLELNPNETFKANWHIDVLAYWLEQVRLGCTKILLICIPPRSLKSHCASVAFPAYLLGHDPSCKIICASYGQDLAEKFASDCRGIMQSTFYRDTFPLTRLSSQRPSLQELVTTLRGSRRATSVGGALTGFGADYLIIDDPMKPQDAFSDTARNATNDWFFHTLLTRRNDQKNGRIVVIMQRLHEEDLIGRIVETFGADNVQLLSFPAIAQQDEAFTITTPFQGTVTYTRLRNDVLHPEREDHAALARLAASMGTYSYSAQYLQSPTPIFGGMVDERWFRRFNSSEVNKPWHYVIQSWDTANKATELSDYSVCATFKIAVDEETGQKDLYLFDIFRAKLDYPALKKAVLELRDKFQAWTVLIEDKASGTQLIQELRPDRWGVAPYYPSSAADSKIMRMHAACGLLESGHVHIPESATWLPDFLNEVKAFPHGKHDDQVDSMSQLIDWLNQDEQYRRKRAWQMSTVHI